MAKTADFVWLDGKLVPWKGATMHVSAECVLRGENVFEGERAYWSEEEQELYLFRHADHIRRLRQGARIMRMTISCSAPRTMPPSLGNTASILGTPKATTAEARRTPQATLQARRPSSQVLQ